MKKALIVNAVVVFLITFAAVFYINGFVRYPIPSPDARIQSGTNDEFAELDIQAQGLGYEEATIIDRETCGEQIVYLLEKDGALHLVNFEENPLTGRLRLQDDILVTAPTCSIPLKNLFFNGTFEITDSRITNLYVAQSMSKIYLYRALYLFVPILISALGTFLLSRRMRRKQAAYAQA